MQKTGRFFLFLTIIFCTFIVSACAEEEPWPPNLVKKEAFEHPKLQKCRTDQDCMLFFYGCDDVVGINKDFEDEAKDQYWNKMGQDPRVLNCAAPNDPPLYVGMPEARCHEGMCGAWQYLKCLDPPTCTQEYSHSCMSDIRIFTDASDEDSYGQTEISLYALTAEVCAQKCEADIMQSKERNGWVAMNLPRASIRCLFDDQLVYEDENVMD